MMAFMSLGMTQITSGEVSVRGETQELNIERDLKEKKGKQFTGEGEDWWGPHQPVLHGLHCKKTEDIHCTNDITQL